MLFFLIAESFLNTKFDSRLASTNESLIVKNCAFIKIENGNNGASLYYKSKNGVMLISYSQFELCKCTSGSGNGGGPYADCLKLFSNNLFFYRCSGYAAGAFYSSAANNNSQNCHSILECKGGVRVFYFLKGDCDCKRLNFTGCNPTAGESYTLRMDPDKGSSTKFISFYGTITGACYRIYTSMQIESYSSYFQVWNSTKSSNVIKVAVKAMYTVSNSYFAQYKPDKLFIDENGNGLITLLDSFVQDKSINPKFGNRGNVFSTCVTYDDVREINTCQFRVTEKFSDCVSNRSALLVRLFCLFFMLA